MRKGSLLPKSYRNPALNDPITIPTERDEF